METEFYIDNNDIDVINETRDICSQSDCRFKIVDGDDKKVLHCLNCNYKYDLENYN